MKLHGLNRGIRFRPARPRALSWAFSWVFAVVLIGPGCSQHPVGAGNSNGVVDAGTEVACEDLWDCNPGVTCGELVMCQDGQCRPDLGHAIVPCVAGECTVNEDCVVAHPMNCCWGCPEVTSRQALGDLECFYEAGHPPDDSPVGCDMDCLLCFDCVPQPLGARCDSGLCVPTDLGCPALSDPPSPAITTEQIQQSAATYDGEAHLIRGVVLPGEGSCDGEGCSAQYRSLVNGVVRLDGYQCNLTVDVTGDECRASLRGHALEPGGWYEVEGIVHQSPSPWEEPWLEVTGSRLVDPEDLGGHYPVVITGIESDVTDPVCVPPPWIVGAAVDLYVARSGPQVRVAAPAFHCEANLSGGFDAGDSGPFTVWLPIDCDWCDFHLSAVVNGEHLVGEYTAQDGPCTHIVRLEGTRSL